MFLQSLKTQRIVNKMLYNPHETNIDLWKGTVEYFKIEIINFMIDISYKVTINNTDIKIQWGVMFVTACTAFE